MKKVQLLLLLFVGTVLSAFGQTVSGTFTQVPCNDDGVFSATASGFTPPLTFTYYFDNQQVVHSNVNSMQDQLTGIPMSTNSYISVQVSDGSTSAWGSDQYTPAFSFYVNTTNPVCPATMGTIDATQNTGGNGPFTFTWTNSQTMATYNGNNISVPFGEYTGEIIDQGSGCKQFVADSSLQIYQISNISASISTTPAGCTDGTATISNPTGGTAPYTYEWANGSTAPTISNLPRGYHSVTVTDAQGCQSNFLGAYVQQSPNISVNTTITDATCLQADGSAMAFGSGGQGPYTYAWSNGQTGQNATSLQGQTSYTVIATDINGCTGEGYAYIGATTPITVTYTASASQCTAATGSATVTASGGAQPYSYVWNSTQGTNSPTLSNVDPGGYLFKVTDANGCVRTGTAIVPTISTINADAQGATVVCPNTTGSANATASGTNPPFTYLWDNGQTSQQINNVPLGGYSVEITDAVGCQVTKTAYVRQTSPVHVGVSTTNVSCEYDTDGSAFANASGGQAPYNYSFSNGSTTQTANNLGMGGHTVYVTDANGCSEGKYFTILNNATNDDCYCTIEGTVYEDVNTDCILDPSEPGLNNIMIHSGGAGYTFTNGAGHYSFRVPTGTYTISQQVNGYYPLAPCQSNNISVSVVAGTGCVQTVDFANEVNTIHDMKIVTTRNGIPPVPGNSYQQKIIIRNDGTVSESAVELGYEHDGQLPYQGDNIGMTQPNASAEPNYYTAQLSSATINPGQSRVILVDYFTPTDIPTGTDLVFYDSTAHAGPIQTTWTSDYTPWNNVNTYHATVVSSYDPNFKEVYPKGIDEEGYIPSTVTEFDYTIHFQNEGTYFAQNIYIEDQLDEDLDWTTLKPGYSDYDYTTTVSETGLVTFYFADINLPWKSQYGDALSSGLINYSIKRKMNVPQGTEFTNTANIYFDYNPPIVTNTTVNTLNDAVASVDEEQIETKIAEDMTVEMYPVPAQDVLSLNVKNVAQDGKATVRIVNIMGHTVKTQEVLLSSGSNKIIQNISEFARGTYLIQIEMENGSSLVQKAVFN